MEINKVCNWLNKTDGRDKFCKVLQFVGRFLKWHYSNSKNKDLAEKFGGLAVNTNKARKLFALLKSLQELQKILKCVDDIQKDQKNKLVYLDLFAASANFFQWIYDNLFILSQINFIKREPKSLGKKAAIFQYIGLIFTLSKIMFNFNKSFKKYKVKVQEGADYQVLDELKKQVFTGMLDITKTLGDLTVSGMASEILPKMFKINFGEGFVAFMGLVAASIQAYQSY